MRYFIAADVDADISEKLLILQKEITAFGPAKLVAKENMHITFKFLGDTSLDIAEAELEKISRKGAFEADIRSIGSFPSTRKIRVIWAGVAGYEEALHVTIARTDPKDSGLFSGFVIKNADIVLGQMRINKLFLKNSVLTSNGPVYSSVKTVVLDDK